MYQITFENDGKIRVYVYSAGGDSISVSAPVNKLAELLPSTVLQAVRDRCAAFVDSTLPREPRLVARNG